MEPEADCGSDYVPNEWAFEARNRLNREFFALVRREREEANVHPDYDANWDEEGGFFRGVPASSKATVELHKPALGETKEKHCAVCLEDFKEGGKLRMMPCTHSFHQRCLFDWLRSESVVSAHAADSLCPLFTSNTFWIDKQLVVCRTKPVVVAIDKVHRFGSDHYAGQSIL